MQILCHEDILNEGKIYVNMTMYSFETRNTDKDGDRFTDCPQNQDVVRSFGA